VGYPALDEFTIAPEPSIDRSWKVVVGGKEANGVRRSAAIARERELKM
jgi:hypothetical protein